MVAVGTVRGIKYGFRLMGYFLGVLLVSAVISGIGFTVMAGGLSEESLGVAFIGFLVLMVGVLSLYAGVMGTLYKVIADGVERGNQSVIESVREHSHESQGAERRQ